MEQVLIKYHECSRRNEKKKYMERRRMLLIALVKCKREGRQHDVCWQGRKSSQNPCIAAVRERKMFRAISFPSYPPVEQRL